MMRWLFRFAVYFVKPLLVVWIAAHFIFLSVRAIANAVASYERTKVKEEIKARTKLQELQIKKDTQKGNSNENNRGY